MRPEGGLQMHHAVLFHHGADGRYHSLVNFGRIGHGNDLDARSLLKLVEFVLQHVKDSRVRYIHTENGRVQAYVQGGNWYEVELERDGSEIAGLYCDCPYPGLCKHAVAVLLTLRDQLKEPVYDGTYTAVENDWFWSLLSSRPQRITL